MLKTFKKYRFDPDEVKILMASIEDYDVVQNMAKFYAYDLSRWCGFISSDWEFPDDGMYQSFDTKIYFTDDEKSAYLVKVGAELAGFVLLNRESVMNHKYNNVGEFFITAKFQGTGLGELVAHNVFNRYKGGWEVAVIPENYPAQKFWQKTISNFTKGLFKKEISIVDYDEHQPERVIFSFNV